MLKNESMFHWLATKSGESRKMPSYDWRFWYLVGCLSSKAVQSGTFSVTFQSIKPKNNWQEIMFYVRIGTYY